MQEPYKNSRKDGYIHNSFQYSLHSNLTEKSDTKIIYPETRFQGSSKKVRFREV